MKYKKGEAVWTRDSKKEPRYPVIITGKHKDPGSYWARRFSSSEKFVIDRIEGLLQISRIKQLIAALPLEEAYSLCPRRGLIYFLDKKFV